MVAVFLAYDNAHALGSMSAESDLWPEHHERLLQALHGNVKFKFNILFSFYSFIYYKTLQFIYYKMYNHLLIVLPRRLFRSVERSFFLSSENQTMAV